MFVEYRYKYFSAWGENPRKYKFKSTLCVQNIDTIPVYDISIYKYTGKTIGSTFIDKVSLKPDEKIENEEDQIIEYGDGNNNPEEAKKLLTQIFTNPKILIYLKNKNGKLFKYSWKNNFV